MAMIRAVLCDDHTLVRRGLTHILADAGDIEVVAEAGEYGELRRILTRERVDVLLLDIDLPGKHGMDVLEAVRRDFPDVGVLMLSLHPEEQYAVRALRAGAKGYLNKNSAPENLVKAVRTIAAGQRFLNPEVMDLLVERFTDEQPAAPHEQLSNREFQVLRLMASGQRMSDIAASLAISPKTVNVYRARIFAKLGVRNLVEVVHYATRHGIS